METKEFSLDEVKATLQKVINHHLPEGIQFSVANLDESQIFLLIQLLIEKDETKRERIWQKLQKEVDQIRDSLKSTYKDILKIKNEVDLGFETVSELDDLQELINSDDILSMIQKG